MHEPRHGDAQGESWTIARLQRSVVTWSVMTRGGMRRWRAGDGLDALEAEDMKGTSLGLVFTQLEAWSILTCEQSDAECL